MLVPDIDVVYEHTAPGIIRGQLRGTGQKLDEGTITSSGHASRVGLSRGTVVGIQEPERVTAV